MKNLLKLGSNGNLVTKVQQILCQKGFKCPISGTYDQNTVSAVKSYQQSNKLQCDGIVGNMTWQSLLNNCASSKIDTWCHSAQTMEGFFAPGENPQYPNGTPAWINNNPGNLVFRGQPNAVQNGKFAKFKTYQDGYNALKNLFINACTGQSEFYKPTMTLLEFYSVYAPSSDNNSPMDYATHVANDLGVTVGTIISDLL